MHYFPFLFYLILNNIRKLEVLGMRRKRDRRNWMRWRVRENWVNEWKSGKRIWMLRTRSWRWRRRWVCSPSMPMAFGASLRLLFCFLLCYFFGSGTDFSSLHRPRLRVPLRPLHLSTPILSFQPPGLYSTSVFFVK